MKSNFTIMLLIGIFLLSVVPSLIVNGQKTGIVIDGDFSDWSGINPVLVEDEIHSEYTTDV